MLLENVLNPVNSLFLLKMYGHCHKINKELVGVGGDGGLMSPFFLPLRVLRISTYKEMYEFWTGFYTPMKKSHLQLIPLLRLK